MKLSHVFLPRSVARQLDTISPAVRVEVETHLENLASYALGASQQSLATAFSNRDDESRYLSEVEGVRIHFTVDGSMRVIFVHRIECLTHPCP